jgi:phospholipase C
MFATESSGSFTAHQYLIAGQSGGTVDFPSNLPWGCDAVPGTTVPLLDPDGDGDETTGPFPCMGYPTLADIFDRANVNWAYYSPQVDSGGGTAHLGGDVWSAFDAIRAVRYGNDWQTKVKSPETTFFSDLQSGNLPQVSWIIPDFENSDHPQAKSNTGPSWVTSIVNAVGQSSYWKSTAIVVVWDEWGGWYDNVPPPQLDYLGLGIRVPMIVISPYAKRGYISHTQYETGSILKFMETSFGTPSLGATDDRATSIVDCFDFTQPAQPFRVIRAPFTLRTLLSRPPSLHPVDQE